MNNSGQRGPVPAGSSEEALTILTLFSGETGIFEFYKEALARLKKPRNVQFLFIDNSGRPEFNLKLRELGADIREFPISEETRNRITPFGDREPIAHQCERLYNFARPFVRGRKVLIWEHDVIPPADGFERLEDEARRTRSDLISGTIISRHSGDHLAWRVREGDPAQGLRRVYVSRGSKRIFATGFGFLLLETALFRQMPFRAQVEGFPFFGCDLNAGIWAFDRNLRWFVAGSVRCAHLNPGGDAVCLGNPEITAQGHV